MIAALISHPSCQQHHMPADHPERIDAAANQLMVANGIDGLLYQREAPAATDEQLLRVHTHEQLLTICRRSVW